MKIKTLSLVIFLLLIMFIGTAPANEPAKRIAIEKEQHWVNIFPIGTEIQGFAIV